MAKPLECPICGATSLITHVRAAYYLEKPPEVLLYTCRACDTTFSPDPADHYDASYYDSYDDFTPGTTAHTERIRLFQSRAAFLADKLRGGNILDIGCARGDFLDQAAAVGFKTFGLELSKAAASEARKRGHFVCNAYAQQIPFAPQSISAIHMNHVLEHVAKPLDALRDIRRVLKPGGLAIIEVPNEIGPLAIRLKLQFGQLGVPGTPRFRYAPHMIYFNGYTFRKAAERAGLRIIQQTTRPYFPIRPQLSTIPAMLARRYDLLTKNSDLLEIIVTPQ